MQLCIHHVGKYLHANKRKAYWLEEHSAQDQLI